MNGREFEQIIDAANDMYRAKRLADVERNPVEWRYTSTKEFAAHRNVKGKDLVAITNTGRYIRRVESDVDYSGVANGRFITFDAKQTGQTSWPLASLKDHQLRRLEAKAKCGGIAGILLSFDKFGRVFWVPVTALRFAVDRALFNKDRKSLTVDFCKEKGKEVFYKQGVLEWLPAVIDAN